MEPGIHGGQRAGHPLVAQSLADVLAHDASAGAFLRELLDKRLQRGDLLGRQETLAPLSWLLLEPVDAVLAIPLEPPCHAHARDAEDRGNLGGGSLALLEQGES